MIGTSSFVCTRTLSSVPSRLRTGRSIGSGSGNASRTSPIIFSASRRRPASAANKGLTSIFNSFQTRSATLGFSVADSWPSAALARLLPPHCPITAYADDGPVVEVGPRRSLALADFDVLCTPGVPENPSAWAVRGARPLGSAGSSKAKPPLAMKGPRARCTTSSISVKSSGRAAWWKP